MRHPRQRTPAAPSCKVGGWGDNRGMPNPPPPGPAPLTDADLDTLQDLLAAVPAPLEPLDVMALDGFLCGVILQPRQA